MTAVDGAGAGTDSGEQERVLIVDDNPTNLQLLYQTLNGRGYRILAADGGEAALRTAVKAQPQLILLDIMMPGMDGYEVCRRLKADPATRDAAVIFLSALDKTEDKVQGFDLGAVDYITKPFQPAEVTARVETHLTIARLRNNLEGRNAQLRVANERMRADLDAAARVQGAMLPSAPPDNEHIDAAWVWRPCDELAGDSLNVFAFDDRYLGIYVLDVSGHGVPAALLSVTVTRSLSPNSESFSLVTEQDGSERGFAIIDPIEVAHRLNEVYPMDHAARLFFTIIYGVLDTETGEFRYVAAGHPGPLVIRRDGTVESHQATGIPIGVLGRADYEPARIVLQSGDRFFAYTDGIYEERNVDGEEFGMERLSAALAASRGEPMATAIEAVITGVEQWHGSKAFHDDVTLLGLQRN